MNRMMTSVIFKPLDNSKLNFSFTNLFIGGSNTNEAKTREPPAIIEPLKRKVNPLIPNNTPKIQLKIKPNVIFLVSFTIINKLD